MLARKEAYAAIKADAKLAEFIKTYAGKNYTNCATDSLISMIDMYDQKKAKQTAKKNPIQEVAVKPVPAPQDITSIVIRLIDVLRQKKLIINAEYHYILGN